MKTIGNWLRFFPPHAIGGPQPAAGADNNSVIAYTDLINTFSIGQVISITGLTAGLTIKHTDANATEAQALVFERISSSPAADDILESIRVKGRDSGGNTEDYVGLFFEIESPTSGSEDGRFRMRTAGAGSSRDWLMAGGALYYFTLNKPSVGGINATEVKANNIALGAFQTQLLHVQDQKSAGTDGGTFTSGAWRTRTLNTTRTNQITGASLSSNQITLPAGTYFAMGTAPGFSCDSHKARLYNTTDSTTLLVGTNEFANDSSGGSTRSFVCGRFTLAASKVIELQHRCSLTKSTNGFGNAADLGEDELYADLMIWKVA